MRTPQSMKGLETLGRVRLGKYFFMREFLYSEIGSFHRIPNLPDDPDLAIANGRILCTTLLDPLVETFGVISVRSGYRSAALNRFGNENGLNCARLDYRWSRHVWDYVDDQGRRGAAATIVIPWFADQYAQGRDWRDLAHWLAAHLRFHDVWMYPKLAAFNIGWRDAPEGAVHSYIAPKGRLRTPPDPACYGDFPTFRGLDLPVAPAYASEIEPPSG